MKKKSAEEALVFDIETKEGFARLVSVLCDNRTIVTKASSFISVEDLNPFATMPEPFLRAHINMSYGRFGDGRPSPSLVGLMYDALKKKKRPQ